MIWRYIPWFENEDQQDKPNTITVLNVLDMHDKATTHLQLQDQ
jgi:hypothetical protein